MQRQQIFEALDGFYKTLHFTMYACLLIKTQYKVSIPMSNNYILSNFPKFNLHFLSAQNYPKDPLLDDGYTIQMQFVASAIKQESGEKFAVIQETALISYSVQMIRLIFELLERKIDRKTKKLLPPKDPQFETYLRDKLTWYFQKNKNEQGSYGDFILIIAFLRHVFTHSTDYAYIINTGECLNGWMKECENLGKLNCQFTCNLVKNSTYRIEIWFGTKKSDIDWKSVFDLVSITQIYMLLEFFMSAAQDFRNSSQNP